jgi:CDP-4-dehydro-6-deoxyglucose reductase, E1
MKNFLNVKFPLTYNSWNRLEEKAILNIIASGQYTYSNKVKKFEKEFAKYQGMKWGVMTNSGSSANLLAVSSLFYKKNNPLKKGDEVIVPAISWATTYFPLSQNNLKLKIVDVNFSTVNIDIEKLKKAITKKTKLIVVVNILGNPCDLSEIKEICDQKKIYLMEDNCESLGAEINKKKTGTFGIISTSSFFYSHHISTIEGGMVNTNDKELYEIIKSLRSHGWSRDSDLKKINFKNKKSKFQNYRFLLPGYNLRPTEINAAIGSVQLKKIDKILKIRRTNFLHYQNIFKNNKIFHIQKENGKSSAFSFIFIFRKEFLHIKEKVYAEMANNNIEYRLVTGGCILKHDVIKFLDHEVFINVSNANYIHENGFFLGNGHRLLKDKLINFNKIIIKYY